MDSELRLAIVDLANALEIDAAHAADEPDPDADPYELERATGRSQGLSEAAAAVRALAGVGSHRSNPDQLMARALGVCWHPPTSDRWPCSARPESGTVPGDGWAAPETYADHPIRSVDG